MNHQQRSFVRKIVYLVVMAVLLVPLSLWGLPATPKAAEAARKAAYSTKKEPKSFLQTLRGGRVLANLRYENKLSQGSLGKIDADSETMRFATFGLKGFWVAILWSKANEHKMKEEWTELRDVLDKIKNLQPNFVNVWRFQGWNLSFNVSAEWDDVRYRYKYVVEGIQYLDEGQRFNDRESRLLWDESWFTGYKIGRADEYRQFRGLFRDEEMADVPRPKGRTERGGLDREDNWLWSKAGFREVLDLHENKDVPLLGMAREFYYSEPAKCHIRFTEAIVEEGIIGEIARRNWNKALEEWNVFGNQPFVAYGAGPDNQVRLNDLEARQTELEKLIAQLDAMGPVEYVEEPPKKKSEAKEPANKKEPAEKPGDKQAKKTNKPDGKTDEKKEKRKRTLRQKLEQERRDGLTDEEREVLKFEKPKEIPRDLKEREEKAKLDEQKRQIENRLRVTHLDVVRALPTKDRAAGMRLVKRIQEKEAEIRLIRGKRSMLNFVYWRTRCEAEGSPEGIKARGLLHDAHVMYDKDSKSPSTVRAYEKAFAQWRKIYDKHPILVTDGDLGDDLLKEIYLYRKALDGKFDAETFILKDVLEVRPPSWLVKERAEKEKKNKDKKKDGGKVKEKKQV